jgi:hypothetical protein
MGAVFPPVFWEQAHMGALIPFSLRSVYSTRAFDTLMGPDGVLYGRLNLEMPALKEFRLLNAYALILERLHGIRFPVDYPLILTAPEPETAWIATSRSSSTAASWTWRRCARCRPCPMRCASASPPWGWTWKASKP